MSKEEKEILIRLLTLQKMMDLQNEIDLEDIIK